MAIIIMVFFPMIFLQASNGRNQTVASIPCQSHHTKKRLARADRFPIPLPETDAQTPKIVLGFPNGLGAL